MTAIAGRHSGDAHRHRRHFGDDHHRRRQFGDACCHGDISATRRANGDVLATHAGTGDISATPPAYTADRHRPRATKMRLLGDVLATTDRPRAGTF
jgi:hypothetical protein